MTQQPYYPPAQQYPPAPVQTAPAPAPVALPQYPQQAYPVAPQQPMAPQYPGYPQQPYVAPPAQPPAPLAQGTLDDYYSQPSTGGGAGLKFTGPNNTPLIGQSYVVQVTRPLTAGDVQHQTDQNNRPLFWKDGRPKFVMIVPVQLLEPSPNHPDGLAKWYVKGAARDELVRAMAEAGAPDGAPEYGAVIRVTLTGTRPSGPGMNPAHVFQVQYVRPQGAAQGAAPVAPAAPSPVAGVPEQVPAQTAVPGQPVQPLPETAYAPAAQPLPPANYAVPPVQQQVPQPIQQQAAPAPVQAAPAPNPDGALIAPPTPPANLSPEQQALLAQLTQ